MTINIIVAVSDNGVIGKDGKIPWKLSTDLARFKEITDGCSVVMGRKTFESIGSPLRNRLNHVITSKKHDHWFNPFEDITDLTYLTVEYLKTHLKHCAQADWPTFIIGGQQIYDEIFKTPELIHRVYLTRVHCDVEGDAFYHHPFQMEKKENEHGFIPWRQIDNPNLIWKLIDRQFIPKSEKDEYDSTFQVWENRS